MGAVINAKDNTVQFHPEFNCAVSSCLSGIAAAAAFQHDLHDNKHYTVSPLKDLELLFIESKNNVHAHFVSRHCVDEKSKLTHINLSKRS